MAPHFRKVVATDASAEQIESAESHDGIEFIVAPAEASSLAGDSVDLVTVAQALHWFDIDAFFVEARRVLKPDGVLAVWSYDFCEVSPDCDEIIWKVYNDIDQYWPPERDIVENKYRDISMPVTEISPDSFRMSVSWTASNILEYMRTWSATQRCLRATGQDPVQIHTAELEAAWGNGERIVSWPLTLRVGRA